MSPRKRRDTAHKDVLLYRPGGKKRKFEIALRGGKSDGKSKTEMASISDFAE